MNDFDLVSCVLKKLPLCSKVGNRHKLLYFCFCLCERGNVPYILVCGEKMQLRQNQCGYNVADVMMIESSTKWIVYGDCFLGSRFKAQGCTLNLSF